MIQWTGGCGSFLIGIKALFDRIYIPDRYSEKVGART